MKNIKHAIVNNKHPLQTNNKSQLTRHRHSLRTARHDPLASLLGRRVAPTTFYCSRRPGHPIRRQRPGRATRRTQRALLHRERLVHAARPLTDIGSSRPVRRGHAAKVRRSVVPCWGCVARDGTAGHVVWVGVVIVLLSG